MKSTTVSIVIPTFNSGLTLRKCLTSILDQEYTYKEVIIIDGGSIDDTFSIVKEYSLLQADAFFIKS